jgi:hypothetical protein
MRTLVGSAVWLVVSLAVAGCGATASPPPSIGGTFQPTPTPLLTPTSAPPAPSEGPNGTGPSTVTSEVLAAGPYRSTSTGVTVDFEIPGDGWVGVEDVPEAGFALVRSGIEGGVTVTHFDGEVFAEPCTPDAQSSVEASARGFVDWLAAHPELDAADPVDTTLSGQPAIQLDVTADVGAECPETPRIWLWVLPVVGDFHLDEGEAARFIAADVGDTTLVIVIETFDPAQQDDLLEATAPILESLTVTP